MEDDLSKGSIIKHTCPWHDKLITLWTLNRQAKIFLRILTMVKFNIQNSHVWRFFMEIYYYQLSWKVRILLVTEYKLLKSETTHF